MSAPPQALDLEQAEQAVQVARFKKIQAFEAHEFTACTQMWRFEQYFAAYDGWTLIATSDYDYATSIPNSIEAKLHVHIELDSFEQTDPEEVLFQGRAYMQTPTRGYQWSLSFVYCPLYGIIQADAEDGMFLASQARQLGRQLQMAIDTSCIAAASDRVMVSTAQHV